MRSRRCVLSVCWLGLALARVQGQEFLDRVDEALTVSARHDQVRARLSGLLDLEGYYFQQPPPGLIKAGGNALFNPRLSLFLDAQLGPAVYVFVQSRFDRGFDPSDGGAQARADEYALRLTPWRNGRFNFQAGKFATVVGTWTERHLSWDNPFVTAPLPYENRTAISSVEAPESAGEFLEFAQGLAGAAYEYSPLIWGPSYTTGAAISGRFERFDYAAEIKNAALNSPPESWSATDVGFDHPTFGGRLAVHPNQMWTLGISASDGAYLSPAAESTLPPGKGRGEYHQLLVGQDIGFAWHHLQFWAEFYEARFDVPRVGQAGTFAYYFETKYKFAPQFFGALRWNQQFFDEISSPQTGVERWGSDTWRTDAALSYRFTEHSQFKLQYSLQHEATAARDFSHLVAGQFTVRF